MLTNCTFAENTAIGFGGGMHTNFGSPTLANCILWGNQDFGGAGESAQIDRGTPSVSYSCIQGWTGALGGVGNIGADPLFVPGPGGCFYLSQISAGQAVNSPSVDAGGETAGNLDLDTLTTRSDEIADSGIVDMGYHYPITGLDLIMGDFDRNSLVNFRDFAEFQNCFTGEGPLNVPPCCRIFDFEEPEEPHEPDMDIDLQDLQGFVNGMTGP